MKIKGIEVTLYEKRQTGVDGFNNPIYEETPTKVENVLVSPISATEILEAYNLTGRRVVYRLAIPKGDTNAWQSGSKVRFFNSDWRIIGATTEGIESLIPLDWNKKVEVESYE